MSSAHPFLEIKHHADGRSDAFVCRLVRRGTRDAVLLYEVTRSRQVGSLQLEPGMQTFAYFWEDRPYNVYHWVMPDGRSVGFYFNIARDTILGEERLEWTDLGLDLLVYPNGRTEWTDEDEAAGLAAADLAVVETVREELERTFKDLVMWVERETTALRERMPVS